MKPIDNARRRLFIIAGVSVLLHIIVNVTTAYGYFRDEFYYLACSEHLAFGYVDQPPLSILLLAISRFIFGDSLVALRLLPAAAHAVVVFLSGRLAEELGGDKSAQIFAALCAFLAPQYIGMLNFYSMNAFDVLFWTIAVLIVVKLLKNNTLRSWLSEESK